MSEPAFTMEPSDSPLQTADTGVAPKSWLGSTNDDLPGELIDNIAGNLEDSCFLSLRAVSRDARDKTRDGFLTRFFMHRRQLITEFSLQQFLHISSTDLVKKLRSVDFILPELREEWRTHRSAVAARNGKNEKMDVVVKNRASSKDSEISGSARQSDRDAECVNIGENEELERLREGVVRARKRMAPYESSHRAELDSDRVDNGDEDSDALRVLRQGLRYREKTLAHYKWKLHEKKMGNLLDHNEITSALQNLKNANVRPALGISSDVWYNDRESERPFFPAHGIQQLFEELELDVNDYHPKSAPEVRYRPIQSHFELRLSATRLLAKSILCSQFPVTDLVVSTPRVDDFFAGFGSMNLTTLTRLSLSLKIHNHIEWLDWLDFADGFARVPALKHLTLDLFNSYQTPLNIVTAFAAHRLESLAIENAEFYGNDLEELLESQRDTLKHLALVAVRTECTEQWEGWVQILKKMALEFRLSSIKLALCQGIFAIGDPIETFHGTEAVQRRLAELIAESQDPESSDAGW